jgi:hypothetical protein
MEYGRIRISIATGHVFYQYYLWERLNIIQRNNTELILDWDRHLMKTGFDRLNHNRNCHVKLYTKFSWPGKIISESIWDYG